MKKLLLLVAGVTVFLSGCRKEYSTPLSQQGRDEETLQNVPRCGIHATPEMAAKMLKAQQLLNERFKLNSRKPQDPPESDFTPTVIFLDANGQTVENTLWNSAYNSSQPFYCAPAGLTADQMSIILASVSEDFSPFHITVTDNEDLFNNTPKEKRVRVLITRYLGLEHIFSIAGGYGFIGSLWWKDDTPCFVFADVLLSVGLFPLSVAEAVSHETGHTIGLHHQSLYTFDGQFKYEYHSGFYSSFFNIYWAPIMGTSNSDMSGWMWGRTSQGIQDDTKMLGAVGVHPDLISNSFLDATQLKFEGGSKQVTLTDLLNKRSDADMYWINTGDVTFSVRGGGNCDIRVVVYNRDEEVIAEFNDPDSFGISEKTIKTKGNRIYIAVTVNDLLIGDLSSEVQYAGEYTLTVHKL